MKRNLLFVVYLIIGLILGPLQVGAQGDLFVEGYVFLDVNGDGQRQAEEPGIGGVTITVTAPGSPTPLTAVTDLLGYYLVESLATGAYLVEAQPPAGYLCVRCQAQVDLPADLSIPANLALALVVPWPRRPCPPTRRRHCLPAPRRRPPRLAIRLSPSTPRPTRPASPATALPCTGGWTGRPRSFSSCPAARSAWRAAASTRSAPRPRPPTG